MSDDRPTWRPPDERPPDVRPLDPPPGSAPPPGWAPPSGAGSGAVGYPYGPPQRPSAGGSKRIVFVIVGLVVAALVGLLVIAFLVGSSLANLAQLGTRTPIEDVAIGQCFNGIQSTDFQDNREVSTGMLFGVEVVDCAQEHEAELIGRTTWPRERGNDFPGDEEVETFAFNECLHIFETYVGRSYFDSRLEMTYTFPRLASWNAGSRGVECIVHPPVGVERAAGTVRGSNR